MVNSLEILKEEGCLNLQILLLHLVRCWNFRYSATLFCVVRLILLGSVNSEEGGIEIFRNVEHHLLKDTGSHIPEE
jgi:hypothetical protein